MAALPKRKTSSARQGKRRHSQKIILARVVTCSNCAKPMLAHQVCKNCGTYNGSVIAAPKIKTKITKVESTQQK